MVYSGIALDYSDTLPIVSWLQQNPGRSVVCSSNCVSNNGRSLWSIDDPSRPNKTVSIIICTYGRPESLNETLESLIKQTYKDFEVILLTEKGNLAELRDKGLRSAIGSIVSFIDDDVYCQPTWLQSVVEAFKKKGVVGVSGPTTITAEYQNNRDIFKYKRLSRLLSWCFKVPTIPGKLSVCGTPSMVSNFEGCSYEGEVDYLECCNMSVSREEALNVGGFDYFYSRTSEWSEVELALKLRKRGKLIFTQRASLFHRPSNQGIYRERLSTKHRWDNFMLFQKRWIKPGWRTYLYRAFVWIYLTLKTNRMI